MSLSFFVIKIEKIKAPVSFFLKKNALQSIALSSLLVFLFIKKVLAGVRRKNVGH